ncbi:MAG: rcc01693 family protein [Pseudomonadota bacterium]
MSDHQLTDWAELMRLGLGGLGLAPDVFWAMTPVELQRALEGAGLIPKAGEGPMARGAMEALMARFPDRDAGANAKE